MFEFSNPKLTCANTRQHYCDGDQINEKTPIGRWPATHERLAIWGPEVPADFLD